MGGCLNGLKWWWHTSKQAVMRRCILIIFKQCEKWRKRKWWNHPITSLWPIPTSPGQPTSFLYRSSKAAMTNPFCMGGASREGECQQGGMCWQWRPRWHQRHNRRVHCVPCQSSERCSAGGEALFHCSSPGHFIQDCLLGAASRTDSHLNWKEGMAPKKGAQAPQTKVPQDGTPKV